MLEFADYPQNPDIPLDFDLDRMLAAENGLVVLEIGTNMFFAEARFRSRAEEAREKVQAGQIIPVNGEGFASVSATHLLLHAMLYELRLPMITTTGKLQGQVVVLGNIDSPALRHTMVRKKSGPGHSHGGAGVSMISTSDFDPRNLEPTEEFAQPFIIPPPDEDGRRYLTDTRAVLVNGKVVAGVTRKASAPISNDIISGRDKVTTAHFPTADHPGEILEPDPKYWGRIVKQAEVIAAAMANRKSQTGVPIVSPLSPLGYCSMDFLLNANGVPLLVDFDLQPSLRPQVLEPAAAALTEHLIRLARHGDQERTIVVNGFLDQPLMQALARRLFSSGYPQHRIALQRASIFAPE